MLTTLERLRVLLPQKTLGMELPSIAFDSAAMDSLDYLFFVRDVEEEFRVKLPDEMLSDFDNVGALASWLDRQPHA